ncbi:hypothetical protein CHARACLAT_024997 [Characodon lateralis]|uniref:Apoptosis facilitator Bcl-2-like protein 14 n=1 Tax=Characodon lateralis TaxID=208331 RepID=A0ABU7D0M6_9TELE|nr:hypothetical protein [Characodon lateralis]
MENGQVENHVPKTISGTKHLDSNLNCDTKHMDDTVEFRLMMAYAQRRRPKKEANTHKVNGLAVTDSEDAHQTPSETPGKTEKKEGGKKKRKKTMWRHLKPILRCVKPQIEETEPTMTAENHEDPNDRCLALLNDQDSVKDEDGMGAVADRVIGIVNEIQLTSQLETDCVNQSTSTLYTDAETPLTSEKDHLEKMIGLLLRDSGDRLDEEFNLARIAADLFWDYNFFTRLLNTFLVRIGFRSPDPDALGPQAANKTQIAATCEITSRLCSVEALPGNQLLQHGARYLQEYYSSWAQQQGGYEEVFQDEEEVD